MFSKNLTALRSSGTCLRPTGRCAVVRVSAEAITIPETRRLLTTKGWSRAWIDGVTERVSRNQLTVSSDELSRTLDFLEAEGVPPEKAEHMAAISWHMLARTPEQMSKVIAYLKARGVHDVPNALFQNPKMLEYDVSSDGAELVKDEKSRIKVDVLSEDGVQKLLVNFYRVGTAFKMSPISPWKPSDS